MTTATRARIGFITPTGADSPHFEPFRALVPAGVHLEIEGLGLLRDNLYELGSSVEPMLQRAVQVVSEKGWQGVVLTGAPPELLNPGLQERLQAAVPVPATTALNACVAALRSLGASRILLLTPFDEGMNQRARDYLAARQIDAVCPPSAFDSIAEAMRLPPDEVYRLATSAFRGSPGVQAIYFQGAVLDPIAVLDRIEAEVRVPVVASNPAMLWYVLSRLGLTYHIEGYGQLLRAWPALPES